MIRTRFIYILFAVAVVYTAGAFSQRYILEKEITAFKRAVSVSHCTGEITYPEMIGE